MNKQEYNEEIERIEKQRTVLINKAGAARANSIMSETGLMRGYKIKDKFTSIVINKLSFGTQFGCGNEIFLIAIGTTLTKAGRPRKDEMISRIYIQTTEDFELMKGAK